MKNVLVIGSTGQIGSELTMKLRGIYGGNIVAGYIPDRSLKANCWNQDLLQLSTLQTNSRLLRLCPNIR